MARTWLEITVELVSGRGEHFWPRPGRTLLAKRSTTFREMLDVIAAAPHLRMGILAVTDVSPRLGMMNEPPVEPLVAGRNGRICPLTWKSTRQVKALGGRLPSSGSVPVPV